MEKIICSNCLEQNIDGVIICEHCKKPILLNEKYKILKILGENVEITFLAEDIKTDKKYTIKEFSIKKMKDWKEEELFKREQKIVLNFDNEFIPKIVDTFEIKKGREIRYYTVVQFIEGRSLADIIKEGKNFTKEEIIDFFDKFSKLLNYIHTNFSVPIVHRDIKPSNIIVKNGEYYLIDFGSVTDLIKGRENSTVVGTFGYMAPEQFMGKADISSDYYSMGIVAIEMLIGYPPEKFIYNNEVDWENIYLEDNDLKLLLKKITAYKIEDRVNNRGDFLQLFSDENKLIADEERLNDIKSKYDIEKVKKLLILFEGKYHNITTPYISWIFLIIFGSLLAIPILEDISMISGMLMIVLGTIYILISLYSSTKKNFITDMINLFSEKEDLELTLVLLKKFLQSNNKPEIVKEKFDIFNNENIKNKIDKDLYLKIEKDFKDVNFFDLRF